MAHILVPDKHEELEVWSQRQAALMRGGQTRVPPSERLDPQALFGVAASAVFLPTRPIYRGPSFRVVIRKFNISSVSIDKPVPRNLRPITMSTQLHKMNTRPLFTCIQCTRRPPKLNNPTRRYRYQRPLPTFGSLSTHPIPKTHECGHHKTTHALENKPIRARG
jgi:hypothetical protein